MPDLSIIILSFNTVAITKQTLDALYQSLASSPTSCEVIVVDNASTDSSAEMLKKYKKSLPQSTEFKFILNKHNDGFSRGNNIGLANAIGRYVLFLNSDVIVEDIDWQDLLDYMSQQKNVAALTVRVELPTGAIDPASHRGFPTPWNAFCYFLKLESMFKNVPFLRTIFGGYHLVDRDLETIHEIDSPTGAFFLAKKELIDRVDGFDEDYFMYGEDLDLSYRLRKIGYKIMYYPKYKVIHLKYQSGIEHRQTEVNSSTRRHFYEAMKIFYQKHYERQYPSALNSLIYFFINSKLRSIR